MQYSSKPPFNDDPEPVMLYDPIGGDGRLARWEAELLEGGEGLRFESNPRPEYNRPQHNPTNPILTEFRGASSVYSDAGHEFQLAVSHYLSYLNSDVYGWAEEHKDHARRVLGRLAAS